MFELFSSHTCEMKAQFEKLPLKQSTNVVALALFFSEDCLGKNARLESFVCTFWPQRCCALIQWCLLLFSLQGSVLLVQALLSGDKGASYKNRTNAKRGTFSKQRSTK